MVFTQHENEASSLGIGLNMIWISGGLKLRLLYISRPSVRVNALVPAHEPKQLRITLS